MLHLGLATPQPTTAPLNAFPLRSPRGFNKRYHSQEVDKSSPNTPADAKQAPPFTKAASKREQSVLAHFAEREQTRDSLTIPKGGDRGVGMSI